MSHEYVIALGGAIGQPGQSTTRSRATAIAWAADSVLAVGSDDMVRSISRGDSTFLDLEGCLVTAAPTDISRAAAVIDEAAPGSTLELQTVLKATGLLTEDVLLQPGAAADLAFWNIEPKRTDPDSQLKSRLVAIVRDGAFTVGDEHRGPFALAEL